MKILPIFKSHYSICKSILSLDEPFTKKGEPVKNSIFNILIENNLKDLILVDNCISGLLEASTNAEKHNINLYFGLRIWITNNALEKTEESLKKRAKYIIFIKNYNGYKDLIKISSWAANQGFYYEPQISFDILKQFWNPDNLKLIIPFYDSFLFLNTLESHQHVPDSSFIKNSTLFIEDNFLPFDDFIAEKVKSFAKENNLPIQNAQSIYYRNEEDFTAFLSFRCLGERAQLERPNLQHMASSTFNFDSWYKNNK